MAIGFEVSGAFIDVQPEDAGVEIPVDSLAVSQGVVGVAFVAQRDVKIAVRSEMQVATVVIAGIVSLTEENNFRFGQSPVGLVGARLKLGKAVGFPGSRCRVKDIEF